MRFPMLIPWLLCAASVYAAPGSEYPDAAIRAVQFVDENEGWAVGDDGVIWHSIDGGKTWERQVGGCRASLRAVQFLTPYTGYAVGRQELADGSSVGVVLVTNDGGLKWTQLAANLLPGLNGVKFFDARNGIVFGDGTENAPTGVFRTRDGGRSWQPLAGSRSPSWAAADFTDLDNGALGGTWSKLAVLRHGQFGSADLDSLGGRTVTAMKILGPSAVAVGEGGLVLLSKDSQGLRWGFADLPLPPEARAVCDFYGVSVVESHIWIVGRPGSFILHSPDFGKTWEKQATSITTPLRSVWFRNTTHGWAAGDFGLILTTIDGGKNWTIVAGGGTRSAALFVHSRGKSVSLDTIAHLGGDLGYLTTVLRVCAPDSASAPPTAATEPWRLSGANRTVGGAASEAFWQFPLPSHTDAIDAEALLAYWNPAHGGKAGEQLLRALTAAIRIWRPEILITDPLPASASAAYDPAERIVVEAVKEAFKRAGEADAYPEQLSQLGLKVWHPKKLLAIAPVGPSAPITVDNTVVAAHLQTSVRWLTQVPTRTIGGVGVPPQRAFRVISTRLADAATHTALMQGIDLAYGGAARRAAPRSHGEEEAKRPASLEQAIRTAAGLEAFAAPEPGKLLSPDAVLARIAPTLQELPADVGPQLAFTIAEQYAKNGQWIMAREVFLVMVDRYPGHPLALDAYRWLARFHASSEARRRRERNQFLMTSLLSVEQIGSQEESNATMRGPKTGMVERRSLAILSNPQEATSWYRAALDLESRLAGYGPTAVYDPAVQLALQAARRHIGKHDEAKKWYNRFLEQTAVNPGGSNNPWRDCVRAELWLDNRGSAPDSPKPLIGCRQSLERPHLDGKLTDPCWVNSKPMILRDACGSTTSAYPTKAYFAWDGGFLYVGLECVHPTGQGAQPLSVRGRDSAMSGLDRVDILLDLDRDYQTYYRFRIDGRGGLAEDCWGDSSWNPQWFVACNHSPTGWTAEMAIPLTELTGELPSLGKVWAVNVVRTIPGQGVQGWSLPAESEPRPEGMGLLQFIQDAKR